VSKEDPFKVLGIPPNAGRGEIRSAFARIAKATHPDLNPGKPEAEYRRAYVAYQTLQDANFIYVPPARTAPPPQARTGSKTRSEPVSVFFVGPSVFTMPPPTIATLFSFFSTIT